LLANALSNFSSASCGRLAYTNLVIKSLEIDLDYFLVLVKIAGDLS